MTDSQGISVSITEVFVPKPVSGSTDRSPCDLNHAAEDHLNDQLKNVSLFQVKIEESSNEGVDSKANQENEEENGESEIEREIMVEKSEVLYPLRQEVEDCSFYMRTGSCKYGSTCKFNHPIKIQIARDQVREKEDDTMDCKYFLRTGGCKYGEMCRFNHTKTNFGLHSILELNFIGLPIRPGEVECPFYMRNGSCKFGTDCKFNHPDSTSLRGTDSPLFHGNNAGSFSPKAVFQANSNSWSSPRHANGTAPFIPSMLSQSRGLHSQTPEWNSYQERSVFSPSTSYLMPAEEFPERPDQPECGYYLKTGDCKFKSNCKYHHPKNRLPKQPPFALNDKGLPLRPDQNICTHYSRYGICKFGPACKFDHSTGSSQAMVEPSQVTANGNESDGWN